MGAVATGAGSGATSWNMGNPAYPGSAGNAAQMASRGASGAVGVVSVSSPPALQFAGTFDDTVEAYYNRIWVLPPLIDLRNPRTGQPQPYSLWNAFLTDAQLQSVGVTGGTGLVNSAVPPVTFGPTQLIDFSVTITAAAPIEIEALYTFTFDLGSGTLLFKAKRATVLRFRPEDPFRQELRFDTDVMKAFDGTEQRMGNRPVPRHTLSGRIVLEDDAEAREIRSLLFTGAAASVVVPTWSEPFYLDAEASAGGSTLSGDFALADWSVGDTVYVQTPDDAAGELARLDAASDTSLTLASILARTYPTGSRVYPVIVGALRSNQGFSRFPVNASNLDFEVTALDRRALGGKGATLTTYGTPAYALVDLRPLNDEPVFEGFTQNEERIDFGGVIQVEYRQDFSNAYRALSFLVNTREELQFWKLLVDSLAGRREPFYLPTFREDLVLAQQPDTGGITLLVTDSPNYVNDWWPSAGHRALVLNNAAGDRLYRAVVSAADNGDGTILLTLDSALPGTAAESTIDKIEFLELVRLASDLVTLSHHGLYSTVHLRVVTIKE